MTILVSLRTGRQSFLRPVCFALLAIAFLFPAATAQAQIIDWTNTTGASDPWYDVGSNWGGGTAPTATQTARFNQAATYEVWWDSTTASTSPAVGFLNILQGDVTFDNQDAAASTQYLFTINGSGGSGAFSDFSISGSSTSLTNRGLHLQSLGGGEILGGATLTLDGSDPNGAKLTVGGSTGFDVSGNLNVQSGGIFENTSGYIGRLSGSTGTATVTGSGSQWNNSGGLLSVGHGGEGVLNVENGGVVSSLDGYIGLLAGSTGEATISNIGSHWNNSRFLYVGLSGNGTLNVEAGGLVSNTDGYIGALSGSTGTATVTGNGSQWNNSGGLYIGGSDTVAGGNGSLTISDSGLVRVTGTTKLWNSGTLILNGGNLTTGSFDNSALGAFNFNDGTLTVDGGVFNPGVSNFVINGNTSSALPQLRMTNGASSTLTGELRVGDSQMGSLSIEAGGLVSNTDGYIGALSGSTGTATVTGSGSQWNNSGNLYIGGSDTVAGGNGKLIISDSGLVNVTGTTKLWNSGTFFLNGDLTTGSFDNSARGWFFFDDGTLTVDGGVFSHGGSNFVINGNTSSALPQLRMTNGASSTLTGELRVGTSQMGSLSIEAGGLVSNSTGYIGRNSGSTGTATVTGNASQWNNASDLYVGEAGTGTLNVEAGGLVSNSTGYIGRNSGSTGTATVTGSGSQWNNASDLYVGHSGNGTLNVEAGGLVNNSTGYIGRNTGSTGAATVTGSDSQGNASQWNNSGELSVGYNGTGTLNLEDGGLVSNTDGFIGRNIHSTGTATVTGNASQWNNSGELSVGFYNGGTGTLNVEAGGLVSNSTGYIGRNTGSTGAATVTGSDSQGNASQWNNSGELSVGYNGTGTLNLEGGGLVSNTAGYIGRNSVSTGTATVTGSDSQWNNSGDLRVGLFGTGTLNVEAGGLVSNSTGYIGDNTGSTGTATVTGSGSQGNASQWNNSGSFLSVGEAGTGTLNVEAGGLVSNSTGYIGRNSGSTGTATVTGSGSHWNNSSGLYIGGTDTVAGGNGSLTISDSGLVSVTGTTKLWNTGTLNLDGGTLATGTFDAFDGTFNWNAGTLIVTGSSGQDQNSIVPVLVLGANQTLDVTNQFRMTGSEVVVLNGGSMEFGSLQIDGGSILGTTDFDSITVNDISGFGSLNVAMNSNATSTITAEGTMTIGRAGSTTGFDYSGTLNVGSHRVTLLDQDRAHLGVSTTIGDGGHLVAVDGSVLGTGEVLQSTGNALIDGDFENSGQVMGSDLGDYLSFNDNVYGAGSFTGNVRFLQEYNPGNSPGIVELENVDFGSSSTLNIELGGLTPGLFDQLLVSGDMNLDGSLDVSLLGGFTLDFNQEFLIADITGSRTGFFSGLGEGDLVGNYGGMDLFISYGAGNGNDISLFTSVPEPGTAGLLGLAMLGLAMRRRRRNQV